MVSCPNCNGARFYYVQDCTEYHVIDEIHEDSSVDLKALSVSYPHDAYRLECEECGWTGSAATFFAQKKQHSE